MRLFASHFIFQCCKVMSSKVKLALVLHLRTKEKFFRLNYICKCVSRQGMKIKNMNKNRTF
jgi:hypothetical protein